MDYERLEYLKDMLEEIINALDDMDLPEQAHMADLLQNELNLLIEAKDEEKEDEEWMEAA